MENAARKVWFVCRMMHVWLNPWASCETVREMRDGILVKSKHVTLNDSIASRSSRALFYCINMYALVYIASVKCACLLETHLRMAGGLICFRQALIQYIECCRDDCCCTSLC
mmetsp:Transcript_4190/g.7360  ORF Transcript_4190/g.7360 Transcript_4190/m.7360 type:complete len:112 (-) Transcript_4190:642-977(-)